MTRTPARLTVAALLALGLSACGGDDGTVTTAPLATPSVTAPAAACPTQPVTVAAPASISKDLSVRPKVPANTGTVPTQVQVADVVVGDGAAASPGSTVQVKYVGALDKNGKEFDASWNTSPENTIGFAVCGQEVVPGFSVAPLGMKVGGRRLVQIPDAFGYTGGNPAAGIAAGDAITFVIDLVSVQ